ncbi:MAG TPA: hypothetical protein VF627_04565 [Abditibacterium sp.]|jgi:hypothetical protein
MTKYEYATIYLFRGMGGNTLVYLPDASEQKVPGNLSEVTRILNQLGRQGWEIAACVGDSSSAIWTLKRAL